MSQQGRALISALNAGDYQSVDQYTDLSDLDLKIVNHHVHELFERAIRTENFKLFRALLKIPRIQVSGPQYCALRHAAKQGMVEFVSDLARIGSANANLVDGDGHTALHYAILGRWAQKKALDMVRPILLIPGVKVNIRGKDTRTALHYAMDKQWFDVASTLVDAGGHPKLTDKDDVSALSMALPLLADIPQELFGRMLSFDDDLPEEETADVVEAAAPPDDDAHLYSHLPQQPNARTTPVIQVQPTRIHQDPPPQQEKQKPIVAGHDPEPVVRQVITTVEDKYSSGQDNVPVVSNQPKPDVADLRTVMGDQELDDTLVKEYLFLSGGDDPRMRLHRKAVLENLGDVLEALKRSGQRLTADDCRRVDGSTGYNLWHAAAKYDAFGVLLDALLRDQELPSEEELMARGGDGQTPGTLLDNNAKLQAVLSHEMWFQNPNLLTAVLSGLPDKRRRSFSTMIAKAHLLMVSKL